MKKLMLSVAVLGLLFTGCESENQDMNLTQEVSVDMSDFYLHTEEIPSDKAAASKKDDRACHTMAVLNRKLQENPGLYSRMYNVEKQVRTYLASKKPGGNGGGNGGGGNNGGDGGGSEPVDDGLGVLTIPVVVHVLYSNALENISDAQIQSQIDVLNADFNAANADASLAPAEFAAVLADSDINFVLTQVIRKSTSTTAWGTNDAMKFSSQGGSDAVDPTNNLNIWVCNIGGGILGYAQFPGGALATDGVVVGPQFFGTTGYVQAPFDKGRTTTHEVGHYLNLRHIWGDGPCRFDDFVADTPASDGPNYGCPSYPTVNCRSADMTMNYMDYTNDACMYMFSEGQKERMRALFAAGGVRSALVN